ncbi:MAG: ThuA domain-containing protein [Verrucomicrobiota bacterium]
MLRHVFLLLTIVFSSPLLNAESPAKVVFLTGDDEYRSEESMPMIAKILERDFGFDVSVGFSLDENGHIDPAATTSLTGTETLADADLLVLFLRFRRPDEVTFQRILDYLRAGKPVVAFRTSTHAFRFEADSPHARWGFQDDPTFIHSLAGGEQMRELVGQKWITHHGHFDDGKKPLTGVSIAKDAVAHPILRGVEPFEAFSWLYHVEGGGDTIAGDPSILLNGKSLQSKKEQAGELDRYPIINPVAWTKTHNMGATPGRVFTTTLGHPYDFKIPAMRRLSIQGILWALGKENSIPETGVRIDTVDDYEPNNSGFGDKFKANMKPSDFFVPATDRP